MQARGGEDTQAARTKRSRCQYLPLLRDLYAVKANEHGKLTIRSLHKWLPAWETLDRIDCIVASDEEYSVGVYAYVRLAGRDSRAPALILEGRRVEDGRQLCLLAWLYTRLEAKAVYERAGSAWPIGQEFILSTHLQIVDCDTLDGVLESTLLPNARSVLDIRAGHSALRSCSSPTVCWLFAMLEIALRDSWRWPKNEHGPNLRAIRKEGVSFTPEASSGWIGNPISRHLTPSLATEALPKDERTEDVTPWPAKLPPIHDQRRRNSAEEVDMKPFLDDTDRSYGISTSSHCYGTNHDPATAVFANEAETNSTMSAAHSPEAGSKESSRGPSAWSREYNRRRKFMDAPENYVYEIRCELQRRLLIDSCANKQRQLPRVTKLLKRLEVLRDINGRTIQQTRIAKILRLIVRLEYYPQIGWVKFRERCQRLLEKWQLIRTSARISFTAFLPQ